MHFAVVFLGGGIGALLRFLTIKIVYKLSFKYEYLNTYHSIIIVNLIGCLFFAAFLSLFNKSLIYNQNLKLFIFTGILASYTTFSTFVFESFELYFNKGPITAFNYFAISIVTSFIGFLIIYKLYAQN